MTAHIFQDVQGLNTQLATDIRTVYEKLLESGQLRLTLALSGGNSPGSLLNELVRKHQQSDIWKHLDVYWVDERFVPHADPESNFGNAYPLLKALGIRDECLHPMVYGSSVSKSAEAYHNLIASLSNARSHNPALFDLTLLGIGPDGHVASLFPGSNHLEDKKFCKATQRPESGQDRVSLTLAALNRSQHCIYLAYGTGKTEIVSQVYGQPADERYPASLVRPLSESLWYMDQTAASQLSLKA